MSILDHSAMTTNANLTYTPDQVGVWLRGLVAVAWADGHFDPEEKSLIEELLSQGLQLEIEGDTFTPITPEELAAGLGGDPQTAEDFLRTAVMVALADGLYSSTEDQVLEAFCQSLKIQVKALEALRLTLDGDHQAMEAHAADPHGVDALQPMRSWLDGLDVKDPKVAKFLCKMIPSQCPFERDVTLFGHKVVHIPPLCKLNPLYEQMVGIRFRALSYLADDCHEDISSFL
jgi:tellurite resistance protein